MSTLSLTRLAQLAERHRRAAVCTVVATQGSTPRKMGARMVVIDDGSEMGAVEGTIGGGAVEHHIRKAALDAIARSEPSCIEVKLTSQLGMCCGGAMSVFVEPFSSAPPLIIFGAGGIAQALCRLATQVGFDVTVADPRPELLTQELFPLATHLIEDYSAYDMKKMPFGPEAYVVVVTHDHQMDQKLTEKVLEQPFRYAAMVGSVRKAKMTIERCQNRGLSAELIERLRSPAGLNIGAETPEEIALAIVAEMVQVRRTQQTDSAPIQKGSATSLSVITLPKSQHEVS